MGCFFSNCHIYKCPGFDADAFPSLLTEILSEQGYQLKNYPEAYAVILQTKERGAFNDNRFI